MRSARRLLPLLSVVLPALLLARQAPGADDGIEWARGAVVYEIFVRSFADSNGDGIGDLNGLTARLDYLNDGDPATTGDLGVDAIWLMPIFPSPSYHGYDVTDYEGIEPDYGTLADFDRLVAEAHRRGIKVILDFVMNHTSDQHPWFVDSARGPASTHRRWYLWRGDDPGWTQPWGGNNRTWHEKGGAFYYGLFWGGMPDLNFAFAPVREEMRRLFRLWLGRGVDGFRLDATRHLFADGPGQEQNDRPATHEFLRELAGFVRLVKPEAILVGENWTDTATIATYYGTPAGGGELPLNFDFPLAAAIVDAVHAGDPAPVAATLDRVAALYPPGAIDALFLTSHDMIRVATLLEGDPRRMALAASILLTLPGAPFLYYGEEVGLANGPGGDDTQKRTPMPWDPAGSGFSSGRPWIEFAPGREAANVATEEGNAASLLLHYRRWIRRRHLSPELARGTLTRLDAPAPLLVWTRELAGHRVLVVHNLGAVAAVAVPLSLAANRTTLIEGEGRALRGERGLEVTLPALASAVFELD
jgi:glycosidase